MMTTITFENNCTSVQEYRQLRVWQRAMELGRKVSILFSEYPAGENLLVKNIIATAIQIPACIAGGYSRGAQSDLIRSLNHAKGDLAMLDTYCMLSHQLNVIDLETRRLIEVLVIETTRLIDQSLDKWQSPL